MTVRSTLGRVRVTARAACSNVLDSKKSLGKTIQTLTASVLLTVLTLGTSMLTARVLGAEGRGEFAALTIWPQLLACLASLGLPNSFIYHSRKNPEAIPEMLGWTYLLAIMSATILTLVGWYLTRLAAAGTEVVFVSTMISKLSPESVHFMVNYLWIAIPVAALAPFISNLAQGLSDFGLYNGARVLWPFIHLVAMVLFWMFGVFTAQIAALCYVGAGIIAILWTVWCFQRQHRARFKAKVQNLKDYFGYALKTYGLEVLGLLSNQIDKVFILGSLSLRELGIYSVAFGLSRVLGLLQNSIASVIFPAMVNLPVKEVVSSVARAARIAIALNLLGGLPLLLFGGFILKFVFGHEFAEGSLVLQLLVLEVIISGTAWVLAQAFNAVGRPGLVVFRQTVGKVVAVIALTFLAPKYGAEGVAFALMLGGIVRVVLTLASFPLALNVSVPSLLLTKTDVMFAYNKLIKR